MQVEKRGRGRPATGPTTITIRVPIALKPAVVALFQAFHLAEQKAWETGPLRRQADDDAGLVAAAEIVLDRIARGEEVTMPFAEWERQYDALDG